MTTHESVVIDKVLGELSCNSREEAVEYAYKTNEDAWRVEWQHGEEIHRYKIYPLWNKIEGCWA